MTYVGLPISSGGAHSLGRMSRRLAFERTLDFLSSCTEPAGGLTYSMMLVKVAGPGRPPELPEAERQLRVRFSDPARLAAHEVADALTFMDEIAPQPTNQWGLAPIWFRVGSTFRIKDPGTGRALPGQVQERFRGVEYASGVPLGTSGLGLSLHNHASLAVNLCIPDPDQDTVGRVVPWLQEHLPFRLSPKQWRLWTPTKTETFRARAIPVPGPRWPSPSGDIPVHQRS